MLSYIAVGLLLLVGLYYLVRLLEVDRINKETPNQDDPFLGDSDDSNDEPEL
jgi:hypothetical protein